MKSLNEAETDFHSFMYLISFQEESFSRGIFIDFIYSQTSITRTFLGPSKFVLDMDSLSH